MTKEILTSAPARICLFGDHQDYLGLPIIACAINRFIEVRGKENGSKQLNVSMPDTKSNVVVNLEGEGNGFLDLGLKVLRRHGLQVDRGFDVEVSGNIPINAGLSSSSALMVAWMRFLIEAYSTLQSTDDITLAKLAYEAEVLEQNGSGGKMDQFAISLGGIIYLDTVTDQVECINADLTGLIVGVSGQAKDTQGTLGSLKYKAHTAIEQVKKSNSTFNLLLAGEAEIEENLEFVDAQLSPYFEAAIVNHLITQKAKKELLKSTIDRQRIGALMNEHHAILKEKLGITTPRIDAMIDAARNAGALGTKIVGSGGGGCIVALSLSDKEAEIQEAMLSAGAVDAFSVDVI